MKRLSKEQILMLYSQLIEQTGGIDGVRDFNLLESAIEAPFQSFAGEKLYPTIQAKGTRLGYGLIKNHCMLDGNKRIGTHAMRVFSLCTESECMRLFEVNEVYTMNHIIIDYEKCIGCGLCVNDCPNSHLYIKNKKAKAVETGCIECGHCFAICPMDAVRIIGYDCTDESITSMTEFDSDKLLSAMKSRRSIRHFTAQTVEEEKLQKILEAGRYCPTGSNSQNVTFTILGSKQNEAEAICVKLFRKGKKLGSPFIDFLKRVDISDNFFFKGAPLVIVLSSKSSINAGLASSYMELMANNLGLGVLYSGFFVICTKLSRKLRKLLRLPKDHEVVSCMVIGYPDVKYQRIVPRKDLQVKTL